MKGKTKIIAIMVAIIILIILLFSIFSSKKSIDNNLKNENITFSTSTNISTTSTELIDNNKNKNMQNENEKYTKATIHTNMGDISFELDKNKPLTTKNFITLVEKGFFNGVKFHRVINGFMIQTGDPLSKDDANKMYWGTGGPGYKFADELTGNETYDIGTVAMANSGPNTNGSQFFIMTSNTRLQPDYTVFGKVIAGQDIAQKIQDVATDASDRPLKDIIINSIELK